MPPPGNRGRGNMVTQVTIGDEPARASFFNDPKVRGVIYQVVVFVVLVVAIYWIIGNTIENLRRANKNSRLFLMLLPVISYVSPAM